MDKSSIYAALREKIVLGDYKPGQVLKEKRLMEEFHIGRTPLRELLIRLNTEGLIEMFPHAGIYVSSVDFQHLVDVVEVRRPLIRMSGQLVAERATSEEIKQMKDFLGKFTDNTSEKELIKLDSQFHDLVNKSTHNKVLCDMLQALRDRILRLWILPKDKSFAYDFKKDFQKLIFAIEKKDVQLAVRILMAHTESFIKKIKAQL